MKTITIYALAAIAILTGCNVNDSLTPNESFVGNPANSVVDFSAELDGKLYIADSVSAALTDGKIAISGMNGNQQISILLDQQTAKVYQANASGSNLLQYVEDLNNVNDLYSTFFSSNPTATIDLVSLDRTNKTLSGMFSGTIHSSNIFGTGSDSIQITNGNFSNVPYVEQASNFNFGFFKLKEDGQDVTMNTATASLLNGAVNAATYEYYNLSSATSDFNKSIALEIEKSRVADGITTAFNTDRFWNPIDDNDSLAYLNYNKTKNAFTEFIPTSGSVTIDKVEIVNGEKIINGTFNYDGVSEDGTETLTITAGSFSAVER